MAELQHISFDVLVPLTDTTAIPTTRIGIITLSQQQ